MKRIYLGMALLLMGAAGIVGLDGVAQRARERLSAGQVRFDAESKRFSELEAENRTLSATLQERQNSLKGLYAVPSSELSFLVATNGPLALTPENWQRLKEEVGLDWDSSTDWIILNKSSLARIDVNAVKDSQVTETANRVLAMTPAERQSLNAAFQQVDDTFASWVKTSVQREGTDGEMIVRYTIPANPELAQQLTNTLGSVIVATLGTERAALFQEYAKDWYVMSAGGLATMTSTLKVSRRGSDEKSELHYEFNVNGPQGSRGQSAQLGSPANYFPGAFRSIFPGGWRELVEREGIEF